MGAVAVGATIHFCSEESRPQSEEISAALEGSNQRGMVTVLCA
ncbi:fructose-bisphosphate aldolase class I [Escherichia coli]|nr:fructose-bisphosphate aldolase class I [Escherichia coli]